MGAATLAVHHANVNFERPTIEINIKQGKTYSLQVSKASQKKKKKKRWQCGRTGQGCDVLTASVLCEQPITWRLEKQLAAISS